ncbi:MAG: hypothetical protein ACPMAG_08455 [Limisphaerales bacterium]|jgi:predicted Zn-ribbon and HTH transcriptional regulator
MNIFFDLYQNYNIKKAEAEAESAKQAVERVRNEIYAINNRLDTLVLATQALFEIVKEQTGITEDQLVKKMEEIDLRDGVADGRITSQIVNCRKCGRKNNSKRLNCLYCGEELPHGDLFGGI